MENRQYIGAVVFCSLVAVTSQAATLTQPGIPLFDPSLGTLNRVTVTVDPAARDTSFGPIVIGWTGPVGEHQHFVAFPSFQLFGRDFVFPPVATTIEDMLNVQHKHSFDPPAIIAVFEGAELSNFLAGGQLPPGGTFLPNTTTTEAFSHRHDVVDIHLNFSSNSLEASTVFEYTPVPEPGTCVLLAALGALAFSSRAIRF